MYSEAEATALTSDLLSVNSGSRLVASGCGLVGLIRFLSAYYLILVTERRVLGTVAGQRVMGVGKTELFSLSPSPALSCSLPRFSRTATEQELQKLLPGCKDIYV